jgi:hypothetical protein
MAKIQPQHQVLTDITNANFATNTIKCDIASYVTVQGVLTVAGSPSSCTLQSTIDPHELIDAGTATWVSETLTNAASFTQSATGPVTGVRLSVAASGGTWNLAVRQAYDSNIQN